MLPSTTTAFNWDICMSQKKKDFLALEIESLRFGYKNHSVLNGMVYLASKALQAKILNIIVVYRDVYTINT